MFKLKLGHQKTVLILYAVTALFAGAAILSYFYPKAGMLVVIALLILSDIFVEYTGMINPKWHPVLSMLNKLFGWPKMIDHEDPVDTQQIEKDKNKKESE